ncbi:MAG: hypothetical protein R3F61_27195 [Myxococcota bacterium]
MRAHLVYLRGGAPFLSPADALCLVGLLDRGVGVPAILAALDRCVLSRRKSRARRPLTLTAAKVHLGKPPLGPPAFGPSPGAPLDPVRAALEQLEDPAAHELADALGSVATEVPEDLVVSAVAVCRDHQERRWAGLSDAERADRLAVAAETLGDIANLVDADTLRLLAEEVARETLRNEWIRLDTATFEGLVHA